MSKEKHLFTEFGQELLDAENHCNQLKAELQQFRKELPQLCKDMEGGSVDSVTSSARSEYTQKEHIPVKGCQVNFCNRSIKGENFI